MNIPYLNPQGLTDEQIETHKGWRLVTPEDSCKIYHEMLLGGGWEQAIVCESTFGDIESDITYRTREPLPEKYRQDGDGRKPDEFEWISLPPTIEHGAGLCILTDCERIWANIGQPPIDAKEPTHYIPVFPKEKFIPMPKREKTQAEKDEEAFGAWWNKHWWRIPDKCLQYTNSKISFIAGRESMRNQPAQ